MRLDDLDRPLRDRRRFLRYISDMPEDRLACWWWDGPAVGKPTRRYGVMGLKVNGASTNVYAHRLTVLFADGEVPDDLSVGHKCGHGLCVRRTHVYMGTAHQNIMSWASGSDHPHAKLTEDKVRAILERLAAGESKCALARAFGVHPKLVYNIATGRAWRHISLPRPPD